MKVKFFGEIKFPYYYIFAEYKNGKIEEVYWAGNSRFDNVCTSDRNWGLSLQTMKDYCEQTGKEIAEDENGEWLGIQSVEWEER